MTPVDAGFGNSAILAFNGPTLQVQIGKTREATGRLFPALIDTGAIVSCIDKDLAEELHLIPVDEVEMAGVHGVEPTIRYMAMVHIATLNFVGYGYLAGLPLRSSGFPQSVLLGRDFLKAHSMLYDGITGSVLVEKGRFP